MKSGSHPTWTEILILFLPADSEDEARKLVDSMPIVERGLLRFEVEPLGAVMHL